MDYFELSLSVEPDFSEILMAELAEIGFDSFVETDEGLQAYVLESEFQERDLKQLMETYAEKTPMSYSLKKIEKQNWNEEWESNFSPIEVLDKVYIRATFHEPAGEQYEHEIVITPKMSFGTGHHETTSQVMALQLEIDHKDKSVLDVGTGTGILAILAAKLGATKIHAFDIDEWSVENTQENIQLNHTDLVTISLGTIDSQKAEVYDIVLANINRNILLEEIPKYATFTSDYLLLSGFYEHDIADIQAKAEANGLKKIKHISKNNWAAVVFRKH
ncbi:50S ribosomal protein L11 methyltransferase [Lacihabitans soyangensis]|jgi:ribosomal protein L11 methyltransferase|uniref:Ribosomal protein L11 methyltransferase n=1 Tax=Lacihabitans soyangensis TaxID=869394 RepID=A0AAE3H5K6_9BACT|nr:50S ribosomal protein L11 methyltransferase [Lacihabitans soyangensis]MCP9764892.1 50S ribosomal protein L11 methyltransferase [Lacihabitans soyangensis]